jgi:hypothetical protein
MRFPFFVLSLRRQITKLTAMKLLLLPLLLMSAFSLCAQKGLPAFGSFDSEDISLTQCDFDKDADAIILLDVANSNYGGESNLITTRRIRLKILKEKGIERANVEIPYYTRDDFGEVTYIEAISSTLENNVWVTKSFDKKAIFKQKINDRWSLVKFTLPNVRVGTIIEYEYETDTRGGLDDWYFQSDIPVKLSRYSLTVPSRAEFAYEVHKTSNIPIKITSDKSSGSISFEMNNIAGLRYEPYMAASRDYLQHVKFQLAAYVNTYGGKINYITTWKEAASELLDAYYFGKQLNKDLPGSEEIIEKANAFSTPYSKMNFLYEYVKNNFTWNKMTSITAGDGIKNAWSTRKGTSGEINLILINLLKQAGLEVQPLLVSERDNGKVNAKSPILDQFNKVAAYMQIGNRKFVLDATNAITPANIIPFSLLNTNAFVVNSKSPEIITLIDNTKSSTNFVTINSVINNDGLIDGHASVNSYDYAKVNRLEYYREDKEKFRHEYFESDYPEIKIDSFKVTNTNADSLAFEQQFDFTMPAAASGDYKLINVNLFSGLEKNQFTLDNRFTDVDFGCIRSTIINEDFELSPSLKTEEIPKNVQLVMPDKSISFVRMVSLDQNILSVQMSFKIKQTLYTVEDYPTLKEFFKKMHSILSEQIVLSKNDL